MAAEAKAAASAASACGTTVKVALAQLSPVYMNRDKTLEKVVQAIEDSAKQGASIMATGEALVPGASGLEGILLRQNAVAKCIHTPAACPFTYD